MSSPPREGKRARDFESRYGVKLDADYPLLPYGSDAKRSLIAKAVLGRGGVERVSFLPVQIDRQLRPEVLRRGDSRFEDSLRFMEWVSEGFDHRFTVDGDEVRVTAAGA
jgi:poly-gamma-glutamate synthesis protein (capsule biosynthesis protein)